MVNYVIDLDTPVLSETIKVEKGQEFLKLDSLNIPAGYVLGDNGGDSIYIEDLNSIIVFVKEKPFVPEETHRDLMVNYVIDLDTPVLSETIKVEKGQEFLKLDSLNIPAGYVLGDNGGDSIYIENLNSVIIFVKEKPVDPEINSKDVTVHIQYFLNGSGATLLKDDMVIRVTEGEEPTLLKAADLGIITVDGKKYRVHSSAMDLPVEYKENVNEYYWAVAMEEYATEPEETYADATPHRCLYCR